MKNIINKMFVIESILLVVLGILFFVKPIESLTLFSTTAGVLLVIVGALEIVRCYNKEYKEYYIFNSLVNILFGLILALYPLSTISTLLLVYGILAIVKGLYLIIVNAKFKKLGMNIETFTDVLVVILGLIVIINPVSLIAYIPYIIGLYFIITAILKVYLGYKLQ